MKKILAVVLGIAIVILISSFVLANVSDKVVSPDYSIKVVLPTESIGSALALEDTSYTLEEMLEYAIEDEYMAKAEYEYIINELDGERPFTNIVRAEEMHIEALEPLFEAYGVEIPSFDTDTYLVKPDSIESALELGIHAEIVNIEMYENFLKEDLPDDVRTVFEHLKEGSEKHLKAFENGVNRNLDGQRIRGNRGN